MWLRLDRLPSLAVPTACQAGASTITPSRRAGSQYALAEALVLHLLGVCPAWPHSGWGYGPSGGLGLVLLIVLILLLTGRL
jgi:hypothetical protein